MRSLPPPTGRAVREMRPGFALPALAAAAALLLGAAPVRAELLANDSWLSGQAVNFQGGFVAGETAAVRLVPTGPCPCQVDEVRFLFGGAGGTKDVTLHVWDDSAGTAEPGAEIYSAAVQLTGANEFMQSIDLRPAGVMVNGPFRVGLEFTHAGFPSVASDISGIQFGHNFIDEITFGWVDAALLLVSGDWIIRAVVDSGTPAAGGTLLANDGWLSGQPAAFQGGFTVGETAAVRLVPPGPCPCRFDKIQFLFGGAEAIHEVTFRIWDDSGLTGTPGAELYSTTLEIAGSNDVLQEVDISAVGLMIDGPVRVGLEFSHAGLPSVARDNDGIQPGRNFIDEATLGWVDASTLGVTGDWIIRGVLDSESAPSSGTLLTNDSWLPSQPAAFQGGFVAGETAAARFVPAGPCPCRLDKLQFLFGGGAGTHPVTLRIWNDGALTDTPGAELYSTTLELTGSDEFLQEVDLGVIGLMVNGPFRVGLEFTHSGLPSVARDTNGIQPDRNFVEDTTLGWVEASTLGLTGDWILRALLDVGGVGELVNNDTWVPGQAAAFQGGFVAGETAAARFVPTGPCPCGVDKIRFLFGGAATTENVTLRIWEDDALTTAPGAQIFATTLLLTGSGDFLQELDLTVAGITVDGPFRVGFEFQHAGLPSVARDQGGISADRNFVDDTSLGWVEASTLGLTGDFVIRAVLNSLPGTMLAADNWLSAAPAAFASNLDVGDTPAVRLFPSGPCPCTVQDVRFLLGGATGSKVVTLHIWDDAALGTAPGAELYARDVSLAPDDRVMQVIDLQGAGVSVSGPFRIGIEFRHDGAPSLATDDDGITPGRSFLETPGGGWADASLAGVPGDWILRASIAGQPVQVPALPFWGTGALLLALSAAAARRLRLGPRSSG